MIDRKLISQLRAQTGAGMNDCLNALEEARGDEKKALEILRKQGAKVAAKKAARETNQGIIEAYIHPGAKVGVLLKVVCETDFVARNEEFKQLAHDLAMQIAAMNPLYVAPEEVPAEVLAKEKEIVLEQIKDTISGKPQKVVEQIVEGKMNKYFEEVCLLNQRFIKDEDITVDELVKQSIVKLGENIKVKEFVRYNL